MEVATQMSKAEFTRAISEYLEVRRDLSQNKSNERKIKLPVCVKIQVL